MQKPHLFLVFTLALLTSLCAGAEIYTMRANSYFLRSNPNFGADRSNIVGVLTRNSTFEILERQRRPDGSEALRIRVTRLGRNGNTNPSDSYWLYKSNETDFVRNGQAAPTSTAGDADRSCTDCRRDGGAPVPRSTRDDLGAISREATRGAEEPPAPAGRVPTGSPTRDQVRRYSSSGNVDRMIRHAERNFGRNRRGGGRCYRRVKESMVAGGLIPRWYSDLAAKNAVNTLKTRGFINLLDYEPYKSEITQASQAPKGAILVYENVPARNTACRRRSRSCGHIEIKMGNPGEPGYISDYRSPTAISQTPASYTRRGPLYRLIGVMVKVNL